MWLSEMRIHGVILYEIAYYLGKMQTNLAFDPTKCVGPFFLTCGKISNSQISCLPMHTLHSFFVLAPLHRIVGLCQSHLFQGCLLANLSLLTRFSWFYKMLSALFWTESTSLRPELTSEMYLSRGWGTCFLFLDSCEARTWVTQVGNWSFSSNISLVFFKS